MTIESIIQLVSRPYDTGPVNKQPAPEKNARNAVRSDAAQQQPGPAAKAADRTAPATKTAPRDTVNISPEARAAAEASKTYAIGSGYSSAGKSFDQVKQEMRTLFDVRSKESGLDFRDDSITGPQGVEVFGDITDLRALFAVWGDTTGAFGEAEKSKAHGIMWDMKEKAQFLDRPFGQPQDVPAVVRSKGLIDFLDRVSPEEKATFDWVAQRVEAQVMFDLGRSQEPVLSLSLFGAEAHQPISTGDKKVDSIIQMLMNEWRSVIQAQKLTGIGDTDAYAQAKEDFAHLLSSGHEFTYTTPDAAQSTIPDQATPKE